MATNNALNANATTPLVTTYGGTGVNAVTTAPTATAFAGWDANKNLSANNYIEGYTTTATGAGTTTLTVGSTYQQFFTGSTTQTVVLPVTSTLTLGQAFLIVNNSTGAVTVQSSGANTITTMAASTAAIFTCILTSGTTAASWSSDYNYETAGVTSITGTTNQVIASAATGAVTLSLPQSIATTSAVEFASVQFSGTTGHIFDTYGNVNLRIFPQSSSVVNYFSIESSNTGVAPVLGVIGGDTNVNLEISPQGTGAILLGTAAPTQPVVIYSGTGSQHATTFQMANSAASQTVTFPDASFTVAQVANTVSVINVQVITATGAYTYTPTAGTLYAIIEIQGGGGGSGGSTATSGQAATSGAGGSGAYMKMLVTAANIGSSITGSVGIAGTAGSSGNNAGGTGGNTTAVINSSTWTAGGGVGGGGQTSSATSKIGGTPGAGGANTTGSNATLVVAIAGQLGGQGFSGGASSVFNLGPSGPNSPLGIGGSINTASSGVNTTATGYGAGAGGAYNGTGANIAGYAGGQGIVIVTEFIA